MTQQEINDFVREKLKIRLEKACMTGLHVVSLFWISVFGTIETRCGYFEEYPEAEMFAERIYTECHRANQGSIISVWVNDNLRKSSS